MNLVARILVKGMHIPSFKNHKHSNRQGRVYTDPRVKKLMSRLESSILSVLYSESRISANETDSECWKRLRTALSGLSDDSLREIPECSFTTKRVTRGEEGVDIYIFEL
jgi:hypothetical protein